MPLRCDRHFNSVNSSLTYVFRLADFVDSSYLTHFVITCLVLLLSSVFCFVMKSLYFNLCLTFVRHFVCPSSILSELSVIFNFTIFALNFTVLHSISLFCTGEIALFTNLGLIDMFSANQTAEIVACIL